MRSVRVRLALSYAAFLVVAGIVLLAIAFFLVRYVPDGNFTVTWPDGTTRFVPNRSDLLRAFFPVAMLVMVFLLVVGTVGGWLIAGVMVRPLRTITDAAHEVAAGRLDHRIGMTDRRDEFGVLADTFDEMLDRIQRDLEQQRRFAANASHELRTPIAVSRAVIDVARADPDRDVDAVFDELSHANARQAALVEQLLLLARVENGLTDAREQIDLALVTESAVEELLGFAGDLDVTLDTAPAAIDGSPVLVRQVVTALVQNAIVHNVPGGAIDVLTRGHGAQVELVVSNTGRVIGDDEVATLSEPFQRGDATRRAAAARTDPAGGLGLGLAITRAVVHAHRGRLTLAPRDGGGLVATVTLPASPTRRRHEGSVTTVTGSRRISTARS